MGQGQYRGGRWIAVLLVAIPVLGLAVEATEPLNTYHAGPTHSNQVWLLVVASSVVRNTQVALAALWLAWGTRHPIIRLGVFGAVSILCNAPTLLAMALPEAAPHREGYFSLFPFVVMTFWIHGCVLFMFAAPLRLASFRLERFSADELADQTLPLSTTDFRELNFSLTSIFKWTAVVAMFLVVLRYLTFSFAGRDDIFESLFGRLSNWCYAAKNAVIPLAFGWAVLTSGRLAPRLLIACALSLATAFDDFLLSDTEILNEYFGRPHWHSFFYSAMYAGAMAVSLFVFRYAGYRLLWRAVRVESSMVAQA